MSQGPAQQGCHVEDYLVIITEYLYQVLVDGWMGVRA
jgi:hypothetical protein